MLTPWAFPPFPLLQRTRTIAAPSSESTPLRAAPRSLAFGAPRRGPPMTEADCDPKAPRLARHCSNQWRARNLNFTIPKIPRYFLPTPCKHGTYTTTAIESTDHPYLVPRNIVRTVSYTAIFRRFEGGLGRSRRVSLQQLRNPQTNILNSID